MKDLNRLCMGCMKEKPGTQVCPYCYFSLEKYEVPMYHLKPRTILKGKYLVGKAISEGGFDITYVGWDLNFEIPLVIKEYFPRRFAIRDYRTSDYVIPFTGEKEKLYKAGKEKFIQEIEALDKFYKQEEIVLVRDYFQKNGTFYIVMEYRAGKSFCEFLERKGGMNGNFSAEEIFKITKPVMKSLEITNKKTEEKQIDKKEKTKENIGQSWALQRENTKDDREWKKYQTDKNFIKAGQKKFNIGIAVGAVFLLLFVTGILLNQNRTDVVTADDIASNNIVLLDENICSGDIVSFGKNNREWIVLVKEGKKVLLLAKESVGERQYHTTYEDITWEECSLRQWLNYDFYNDSFSEAEKERICKTIVKNPDNAEYGTEGGNDIKDKIFLLSLDEAEKYFEDETARTIGSSWWLRSSGNNSEFAAEVLSDGYLNSSGFTVDSKNSVRPVLWVSLEA